jgi:hypothetical protein
MIDTGWTAAAAAGQQRLLRQICVLRYPSGTVPGPAIAEGRASGCEANSAHSAGRFREQGSTAGDRGGHQSRQFDQGGGGQANRTDVGGNIAVSRASYPL